MSLGSVVARGRGFIEKQMTTVCKIGPVTQSTDPETLEPVIGVGDPVYEGPCKIRFAGSAVSERAAGGQQYADQDAILSLPIVAAVSDIDRDHVVIVTDNPLNPGLVGARFRVAGRHLQTAATAYRFPVELIS